MEKCQDTHKVKIIMVTYLFLSLIVDVVIKVIADSQPISFLAIYSAISISLYFIGNNCGKVYL